MIRANRQTGFSLLEVLMALIVASILAATLLGAQRHSMLLADINKGTWEALNLGQDILLSKPLRDITTPVPSWVEWTAAPGSRFRLTRERMAGSEYAEQFRLETEIAGQSVTWEWQHLQPLPRLRKDNAKSTPAK